MSDETVAARLPDGTAVTVPAAKADALPSGSRRMSAAEVTAEKKQIALDKKYELRSGNEGNAIGGTVAAGAAGVARGATAGLSDYLAAQFGGGEYLNELKQARPLTSAGGELAGMAGIAAATGGLGAAPEGIGLGGRIALGAARSSAEMAAYEAGRSAGDQALDGGPIDGEKVLAAAGHGAIFGGALGFGGELLGAGLGRALAGGEKATARGATEAVGKDVAAAEKGSLRELVGNKAGEASDEFFANALGASKGQIEKINDKVAGGWSRVAADTKAAIRDEVGHLPADRNKIAEAIESGLEKRNAAREAMLEKVDSAGAGIAPSPDATIRAIREKFITPNMVAKEALEGPVRYVPKFGAEAKVKAAEDLIERLETGFGAKQPTFKEWAKSITDLGKEAKFDARTTPLSAEVKQQAYGLMSEELAKAGEEAAKSMGSSFAAEYKANQAVIQSLLSAEKLVSKGIAGNASNNAFGLTSKLAGTAGSTVGAMVGGPFGATAGGLAGGLVGKLVQDRGAMLAADLLDRTAATLGVRQLAARTEAQMSRGVSELIGAKGPAAHGELAPPNRRMSAPMGARTFPKVAAAVLEAQSNPAGVADRIGRNLGDLSERSPKAAAAITATAIKGAQFLGSKLPPQRRDPYSLTPQLEAPRLSDAEKSKFMRYAEAVDRPLEVLSMAKKGTLTREHVEAVKEVYPNLYEEMRVQVMQTLVNAKSPIPYARRIQLGILLDIPTDKTLSPEFLQAIQATYAPSDSAEGGQPPPPHNAPKLDIAGPAQTATEAATTGLR